MSTPPRRRTTQLPGLRTPAPARSPAWLCGLAAACPARGSGDFAVAQCRDRRCLQGPAGCFFLSSPCRVASLLALGSVCRDNSRVPCDERIQGKKGECVEEVCPLEGRTLFPEASISCANQSGAPRSPPQLRLGCFALSTEWALAGQVTHKPSLSTCVSEVVRGGRGEVST